VRFNQFFLTILTYNQS